MISSRVGSASDGGGTAASASGVLPLACNWIAPWASCSRELSCGSTGYIAGAVGSSLAFPFPLPLSGEGVCSLTRGGVVDEDAVEETLRPAILSVS